MDSCEFGRRMKPDEVISNEADFRLTPALEAAWRAGVSDFNAGRFWHAHESWERGWVKLPPDLKSWMQGLIQVCGSFHLFQIGRPDPAFRLAASAARKLARVPSGPARVIEVPGLDAWLSSPAADIPSLRAFPRWPGAEPT